MAPIRTASLLLAAMLGAVLPAAAQERVAFQDDRSSAVVLVQSLYSAIDRREYARAWSYFEEPPAASFDAYVAGFADTASVAITVGTPSAEGAAGSVFFEVPVILRATATGGTVSVFSGCYTVRQVNPAIQDPPFRPMAITGGRLRPADPAAPAFPADCGGGDVTTDDGGPFAGDRVMAAFTATYEGVCSSLLPEFNPDGVVPDVYEIRFRYDGDAPDFRDRVFRLYRVWCSRGAYSEGHVYYLEDDYGEIRPIAFALPVGDTVYADELGEKLGSLTVTGFVATYELALSDYDPETMTIADFSKWRGLGDASSSGRWVFDQGGFRLDHFEIDPTFDGEFNPVVVVEGGVVVAD